MFRKLVSNLPFSPALVGQIGFYARRLRKEEATRRLGLIMTALALIVQSLAVFIPSTSANSSNPSDLISGGVTSMKQLLDVYDNPNRDYKKIMDYVGITRSEIASAKKTTINSRDYGTGDNEWLSWGRAHRLSTAQGEVKHNIDGTIVYSRPLWRLDTTSWTKVHGSTYEAFVGKSTKMGTFAILLDCGNAVTRKLPPVVKQVTVCRPGVGIIRIPETEKKPTDLPSDSVECKPKNVVCNDIVINKIDRTHLSLTALATPEGAAAITGYVFTIRKDSATGQIVATQTITTASQKVTSNTFELKDAATYYVSVTVKTSIGEKTSPACTETFPVAPPEKCEYNPALLKTDNECKPCPGNTQLWYKSPECNEVTLESKSAMNLTQNRDGTKVTANAGDRIEYQLTVTNPGKVAATADFTEELDDVLDYASILDNGGGSFNGTTKTLSWPTVKLAAGETQTRTFIVALPAAIPTTARGTSEPTSYDCIMNNTFGDNTQIRVNCELPKVVEETTKELPPTGPTENMIFAGILAVIVSFFWARSRQLGKEIHLVRKDFSAGTI